MELQPNRIEMLDMIPHPGFCVKDHQITQVNQAAHAMCIAVGEDIHSLMLTGKEEYDNCSWKGMSLTLSIHGHVHSATVAKTENGDIFLLEPDAVQEHFRSFALTAMALRGQLDSVMLNAEMMGSFLPSTEDAVSCDRRMNRSLLRLMRTICNMSDAERFVSSCHMQMQNICSLLRELLMHAQPLVEDSGLALTWQLPNEDIWCQIDPEQLERSFWNLISNSMKFTPKGGYIQVSLTRRGKLLLLSVEDSGCGISQDIQASLFRRYLRQPGIEDIRYGLGLGMVLVRAAAHHHGGTVFVDHPTGTGARITMTLTIRQSTDVLRSPLFHPDYAGGWDHRLLELSDCLPAQWYDSI